MTFTVKGNRSWVRPRRSLVALPGLALVVLMSAAVGVRPSPAAEDALPAILPAFNQICHELRDGRNALQLGRLSEDAFADRILELFVRADSLATLLAELAPRAHPLARASSLVRSLRYLKDSLRENYEGIVGRDGYRFVQADRSLEAALAWRSGVGVAALSKPWGE